MLSHLVQEPWMPGDLNALRRVSRDDLTADFLFMYIETHVGSPQQLQEGIAH